MTRLRFSAWQRSDVFGSVADPTSTGGRLAGQVELTIREVAGTGALVSEVLDFELLGPGDVKSLSRRAVVRSFPPPGTTDAEATICPAVELAAPDLPWRYTPELSAGKVLRPWLALVVAGPGEAELLGAGLVRLGAAVLAAHPLARAARSAHVQEDAEDPAVRAVTRLLCTRPLESATTYLAVVVPAFDASGQPAWSPGQATAILPAYHHWTFATGEAGDFPSLAARLSPSRPPPGLGQAPVSYGPLGGPELGASGALSPPGTADPPVPDPVAADVAALTAQVVSDDGRPIVTLPEYGTAWVADPSTTAWGAAFRGDPRPRGVAGLGLAAGIAEQDLLADAAATQAGSLAVAAARIRNLTAGLAASRSLWRRRLPAEPLHRLAILGPSLGRMATSSGTVRDRLAGTDKALAPALFTSAARRALRPGPARTARLRSGAGRPEAVLGRANAAPPPAQRSPAGLPHVADLARATRSADVDDLIRRRLPPAIERARALDVLERRFDRTGIDNRTALDFQRVVGGQITRLAGGGEVALLPLLAVLDSGQSRLPLPVLRRRLARADVEPDTASLAALATELRHTQPRSPVSAVADLAGVATRVAGVVDPTVPEPFVVRRVLSGITGLGPRPLAPPELEPELDIPAWQLLRDEAPDWLLPGAGGVAAHSVVAVETNPAFVDAFLLGLNTQVLAELRFRNVPVASGWTPLRQFWARANPATGAYDDDIVGVRRWDGDSALGSGQHQPPPGHGTDLVLVFHTPLFRRYPGTLVYLTPAPLSGGTPDWDSDPSFDVRLAPAFQGSITPEVSFFGFDVEAARLAHHWVVLEETAVGFRFYNTLPADAPAGRQVEFASAGNGADFASAAFADAFRVMIRGDAMTAVEG